MEASIETTRTLLASMGKTGIVVKDSPGFVTNRVLMLTINEAVYVLQDRVATAEDVDAIFKSCFGHKMSHVMQRAKGACAVRGDDATRRCRVPNDFVWWGLAGPTFPSSTVGRRPLEI